MARKRSRSALLLAEPLRVVQGLLVRRALVVMLIQSARTARLNWDS